MKLVKRYYSEQKEQIKQLEEEIAQEAESKSDSSFVSSIMEKAFAMENMRRKVPNPEKECIFQALTLIADEIAEVLCFDIIIESDNVKGTIIFEAENLLIPGPIKNKVIENLIYLIKEAEDISIGFSNETELIQARFSYSLCDEHYVWLDKM